MWAKRIAPTRIGSDLTPLSFARAHEELVELAWRDGAPENFFARCLVVCKTEDLRVVRIIGEMVEPYDMPVVFADIPEFTWILFADNGNYAIYSEGA